MFYDILVSWKSGHVDAESDVTHSRIVQLQKSPSVSEVDVIKTKLVPSWYKEEKTI